MQQSKLEKIKSGKIIRKKVLGLWGNIHSKCTGAVHAPAVQGSAVGYHMMLSVLEKSRAGKETRRC